MFSSIAIIGCKLFSNNPKNINHVRKYIKDLISVIITLGGGGIDGDTVFYGGIRYNDLVLKISCYKSFTW